MPTSTARERHANKRGELFSEDARGRKTDKHLHDPILKGVSREDEARQIKESRAWMKKRYGTSDAVLDQLYGKGK